MGGLTHGSGITEDMRTLWTLSTPTTSQYNSAMQEFSNVTYTTSDQHKEATESRMAREQFDAQKIEEKLLTCSPFSRILL